MAPKIKLLSGIYISDLGMMGQNLGSTKRISFLGKTGT
jgi:hypothetical protein